MKSVGVFYSRIGDKCDRSMTRGKFLDNNPTFSFLFLKPISLAAMLGCRWYLQRLYTSGVEQRYVLFDLSNFVYTCIEMDTS